MFSQLICLLNKFQSPLIQDKKKIRIGGIRFNKRVRDINHKGRTQETKDGRSKMVCRNSKD